MNETLKELQKEWAVQALKAAQATRYARANWSIYGMFHQAQAEGRARDAEAKYRAAEAAQQ